MQTKSNGKTRLQRKIELVKTTEFKEVAKCLEGRKTMNKAVVIYNEDKLQSDKYPDGGSFRRFVVTIIKKCHDEGVYQHLIDEFSDFNSIRDKSFPKDE